MNHKHFTRKKKLNEKHAVTQNNREKPALTKRGFDKK